MGKLFSTLLSSIASSFVGSAASSAFSFIATGGASLWAGLGKYLLYLLAVVALVAAIFGCGYFYRGEADQKAQTTHAQAKVASTVAAHNAGVVQTITVYKQDLATEQKLQADKTALNNKVSYLEGLVNNYVPQSPNGPGPYLSPCLVSLLNDAAATPGKDVSDTDTTTAIFACTDASPGTLTWGEFVRRYIDLTHQYNDWRGTHNALVDWDIKNVVNAAAVAAAIPQAPVLDDPTAPAVPATNTAQTPN